MGRSDLVLVNGARWYGGEVTGSEGSCLIVGPDVERTREAEEDVVGFAMVVETDGAVVGAAGADDGECVRCAFAGDEEPHGAVGCGDCPEFAEVGRDVVRDGGGGRGLVEGFDGRHGEWWDDGLSGSRGYGMLKAPVGGGGGVLGDDADVPRGRGDGSRKESILLTSFETGYVAVDLILEIRKRNENLLKVHVPTAYGLWSKRLRYNMKAHIAG